MFLFDRRQGTRVRQSSFALGRRLRLIRFQASAELLEERQLLASKVTTFPIPTAGASPTGITAAPNVEYVVPVVYVYPPGSDFNPTLYFTESHAGKFGWVDGQGQLHEFALPSKGTQPLGIVTLYDGEAVFTEANTNKIGTFSGQVAEFSLPTRNARPGAIISMAGNAWFSETVVTPGVPASKQVNKIGEFMSGGAIIEFPLPTGAEADALAAGPDGNVWFVDRANNAVGKMTPSGTVTEYKIPIQTGGPWGGATGVYGIAAGADGNLWFTEAQARKIGRVTPEGRFTLYNLTAPNASPTGITSGPDGELWFTELTATGPQIGRIDPLNGRVANFPLPKGYVSPTAITAVGNNTLAFVDPAGNRIGEISTDPNAGYETLTPTAQNPIEFAGVADPNVPVATFQTSLTHSTASGFTATIDWGDGTPATTGVVTVAPFLFPFEEGLATPAIITFAPPNTFQVAGSHTYASGGTYSIHVKITDPFGLSTTVTSKATVSSGPFALVPLSSPNPYPGYVANTATYAYSNLYPAPGNQSRSSDYSATINWGDGTTSPGTVDVIAHVLLPDVAIGNPSREATFAVSGSHVYTHPGQFTITFSVSDSQGHTQTAKETIQVLGKPILGKPSPYVYSVGPNMLSGIREKNVLIAGIQQLGANDQPSDYLATIEWGDGSTSVGTITRDKSYSESFDISGSHTYAHPGLYNFSVLVSRDGVALTPMKSTLNVFDPSQFMVTVNPPWVRATPGVLFTGNLPPFFTYSPGATASSYSAVIDWGDGSRPSAGKVALDSTDNYSQSSPPLTFFYVSGAHTFARAGTYKGEITITQRDGKTSQELVTFDVF